MPETFALRRPCVLVTRPQPQADEWVARLQALGQPAQALPLLRIEPDPAHAATLAKAWHAVGRRALSDLVMFVSPNAVLQFFSARAAGQAWPMSTLAGATGPGTVAALQAQGLAVAQIAAPDADALQFDAEALWTQRLAALPWAAQSVLIVRGTDGRDWLAATLRRPAPKSTAWPPTGAAHPTGTRPPVEWLQTVQAAPERSAWLFSSSEAIGHLRDFIATDAARWSGLSGPGAGAGHASAHRSNGRAALPLVFVRCGRSRLRRLPCWMPCATPCVIWPEPAGNPSIQ